MQVSPTANISPAAQSFLEGTTARTTKKELDSNDFLKLLATQMTTQDPMKPMEDTQFMAQMASFTSLEQMKSLADNMSTFTGQQNIATAASYLGKVVTVSPKDSANIVGTVTGITVSGGKPQLIINGASYSASDISSVKIASSATGATPTTGAVGTAPTVPVTTP